MSLLSDLLSTIFERRNRRNFTETTISNRSINELANELVGSTGEVSGLALAEEILTRFELLDDDGKLSFFRYLASAMNIDPEAVRLRLQKYEQNPSKATYRGFAFAAEPARQELIRRLNQVPGATGILVRMRSDLLRLSKNDLELQALDLDFRHLFVSWFNRGFLVLRPINWESPANILEKIIAYEAVHAIDSWDDMQRRLRPADRRCFAFFHPAIPDEPLIFVEVALCKDIPGSIQALLAENRKPILPEQANTAVFYSISNCQTGLASISFGNSLIKQVVNDLAAELSDLKTFVTLSPIPNLMQWLLQEGYECNTDQPDRAKALAAYYLLNAKAKGNMPFDPVARFHLGNGALIHAVHADADISDKGLAQSNGVMVNYLYDLSRVAQNHEQFADTCEVIAATDVKSLAASISLSKAKESNSNE